MTFSQHEHATAQELAAYYRRIGYQGSSRPNLATLQALHYCHATTIAFENLTPLLRQPVLLDIPALVEKLVVAGRGGYCFEQNRLFGHMLATLGFQVTGLAARVCWNRPDEVVTHRTHMLLRIDIEGQPYLADVGFGGLTLTAPVRLVPNLVQSTPHEPFRLVARGTTYFLQAQIGEEWRSLYNFDLQPQHLLDYELGNWYVSTNPASIFVQHLSAGRPAADCRYALRNNQLNVYYRNGTSEQRTLATVAEFRTTLERDFQVTLPVTPDLDPLLEYLIACNT